MQRLLEADEDLKKEKGHAPRSLQGFGIRAEEGPRPSSPSDLSNLAKVDALYKISLGIGILDLATDRNSTFDPVLLRHDCVHRNGAVDE
ncbi:hypothetical protein [Bradyrhizobium sp. CCGUVB23]|uniref:hypothetical protein n=1 Tax=Bradyrhizobium sp. CCGUVB23 TaxID=2949630 RepID=UPI0020B28835|nr:hypothetical protein [Bradyrhizobium sp. CCGUVB23]MCP3463583.1 hypothetical protein [Bradyrhizobium sp. CCGUVB23]